MVIGKKEVGALGEAIAVSFLQNEGYRIVERNYRIRLGEIDIIAEQGGGSGFY
jgi:putative endonuclease